MSTLSKIDPSTLGWVKTEIDETLKQARLALESYTENSSDESRLRHCATYLHQVLGTLQMVELDGAAMLARETEALASALLNGTVEAGSAANEALIRGILTLPDYLARLQFGQPDAPLKFLPLLNELRALRGAETLHEFDLFQPDLDVRPPKREGVVKLDDETYAAEVKRMRPPFQATLLNWLRDTGTRRYLDELAGMIDGLQSQAPLPLLEQMFWVAGGYLDALACGAVPLTNDRKKLLARLEQQLKKIAIRSERSVLRSSSEWLMKAMLFELGQAHAAVGKTAEIKRAFALEQLMPGSEGGEFGMPTPEALQSVADALGKEIGQAQDLIATYFEQGDAATLEPLITHLHQMSGTLEMLGVDVLKALIDELAGLCQQLQRGELERGEHLAMPMAGAMLLLENSTRNIQKLGADWKQQVEDTISNLRQLRAGSDDMSGIEISDASLTDSEFRQLVAAVGGEVRVNLGKIEEVLETFAADPGNVTALDPIPASLSQIQGALQILGQDHAAELVVTTSRYIHDLREQQLAADSAILDALAVAVGSIGAYIEGLERDRPNLETLLINARHDLGVALTGKRPHSGDPEALYEGIGQSLTAWLADRTDRTALATLKQELRDVVWLAVSQKQDRVAKIGEQMISLLDMVESGDVSDEIESTLRTSHEALTQLARGALRSQPLARSAPRASSRDKAEAVVAPPPVAPVEPKSKPAVASPPAPAPVAKAPVRPAPVSLDVDDDIIQIFIEDAREMIALINKTLPEWQANTSSRDVLLDLRRAFHTLKGSGRMVGASDISEFAWAVENMLNRIREGKIEPSESMFELLHRAREVLPVMVTQLEGGPAPLEDLLGLRAVADALAEGRSVEGLPPPMAPAAVDDTVAVSVEEVPAVPVAETDSAVEPMPSLDPTLLQIFTTETRGHIANVRTEIESSRTLGLASHVPASLVRAVHTLHGSARAVGLKSMAEAGAETEKLMHLLIDREQPLKEENYALIARLTNAVEQQLEALNRGDTSALSVQNELKQVAQAAHAMQAGGVSVPPTPAMPTMSPVQVPVSTPSAVEPETATTHSMAVPADIPAGDDLVNEQLDPELTEIFLEEAVDIMGAIEESLTRWRSNRSDQHAVGDLKRQLHTLKGGARMSGAMTMGNLGHHTESLLGEIESGRVTADGDVLDLLDEVHDALVAMVDQMRNQKPVRAFTNVSNKVLRLLGQEPVLAKPATPAPQRRATTADTRPPATEPMSPPVAERKPEPVTPAPVEMPPVEVPHVVETAAPTIDRRHESDEVAEAVPEGMPTTDRRGQIRVRTALLNELVNSAGEVSIARARMEQQIFGLRENLAELNRNVTRFRDQIRELEIQSESQILARAQAEASRAGEDFDPLEFDRFSRLQTLSRSLAESLHDLFTIRGNLENYASQAEGVLLQQARINTELQEGLMRTRMVGVSSQAARLRHIVRQTAREVGKRVDLELIGGEVEVDRTVLERMIGPLEHMIRNAIDHGIESDAERRKAGKPASGRINLTASHEGSEVVIRFADDGAGLNTAAIRRKAIERGLLKDSANLSDDELIQFILMPGFSTATTVTQLSGRGVGMDVVHSEVKQLGGSITVDTRRGHGTTFIIRLPLTLSIAQALMVRAGDQLFAIPISAVVNILEVPVEELKSIHVGTKPLLNWQDQVYPFMNLAVRLGINPQPSSTRKVPVLLARSGGRQVAIQIDGLAGTREIVIKPLGSLLAGIEGLAGATILGDGSVVLILDVPGLWLMEEGLHVTHATDADNAVTTDEGEIVLAEDVVVSEPVEPERTRALVMIVDDSITVRKVTQRHLQKAGMDVLLAKDGVDAMEQLRENMPDVMLVDIEMPRMDGYELTQHVRSDSRLRDVPIIMITSRAGDKHRDKALSLGVNIYMTKPYQEDTLLGNINSLLPHHLVSS